MGVQADLPPPRRSRFDELKAWEKADPAQRQYWNLIVAIRRRQRKLANSMAHTPRPRPADVDRWRALDVEIGQLKALAVELRPDLHPEGCYAER